MDRTAFDWRGRKLWHTIGYIVSAAWMIGVLIVTGGNVKHPFFNYIFIVPLGLWIAGIVVAALLKKLFPQAKD